MKIADHATVESMQTAQPTAAKIGGFTGGFVKNAALYMVGGEIISGTKLLASISNPVARQFIASVGLDNNRRRITGLK